MSEPETKNYDPTETFETGMFTAAVMTGNGTNGHVRLTFFTPTGMPNLCTVLGPNAVASILSSLSLASKSVPVVTPQSSTFEVPGTLRVDSTPTATYFEQRYNVKVLQALGVLVIRANLLENSLIRLFASVLALTVEQAGALFYSTVNMKARVDMIKAATWHTLIPEDRAKNIRKALDKVNDVTGRRNDLIHAQWSFSGSNFKVETYRPNTASPRKQTTITAKSIEDLAGDYFSAGMQIDAWASDSINAEYIASKMAATPSDGLDPIDTL